MQVITVDDRIIKCWASSLEEEALNQACAVTELPCLFGHVALMPDAHAGYGMPIGGVAALDGCVSPYMVGVDIGCGMFASKYTISDLSRQQLEDITSLIRERIPTGFSTHKTAQEWSEFDPSDVPNDPIIHKELENAKLQLGTLGGGNHFIEIQKGNDGDIWAMIHSGSRHLGYAVANHYHALAHELNTKYHTALPNKDLAFLPVDTEEGKKYIEAMEYCLLYAYENRRRMAEVISKIMADVCGAAVMRNINIHHNYASEEYHFGKYVWVHRKGAISAWTEELGIIPGSMGTKSYIVRGLGNRDSYTSCSHGAGRKLGRKAAQRTLNLDEELQKMAGIVHGMTTTRDLEEAPGAYKDISTVMADQSDLVEIVTELTPLAVVKG